MNRAPGAFMILFLVIAVLLLTPCCDYATADQNAGELVPETPLSGICAAPGNMSDAAFVSYVFPQFVEGTAAAEKINLFYQEKANELQKTLNWPEIENCHVEIGYQILHNSSRYLCIVLEQRLVGSSEERIQLTAQTFALDGVYAGQKIQLTQLLGLEALNEECDNSVASELAVRLVWQIVERECQNADSGYLDGLMQESVRQAFDPENDYFLDEEGNIVFYIQAGEIAGEVEGILTFPFAMSELVSEV